MRLRRIAEDVCFICFIIGAAGLGGTWEQEVTDPQGILMSCVILAVGAVAAVVAKGGKNYEAA